MKVSENLDCVMLKLSDPFDQSLVKRISEHLRNSRFDYRKEVNQLQIALARASGRVYVGARPPGSDHIPGCFMCGKEVEHPSGYMANICMLSGTQEEAELIIEMLPNARIDYYHGDRQSPQVKIGACKEHFPNLKALYTATAACGYVDKWIVDMCRGLEK